MILTHFRHNIDQDLDSLHKLYFFSARCVCVCVNWSTLTNDVSLCVAITWVLNPCQRRDWPLVRFRYGWDILSPHPGRPVYPTQLAFGHARRQCFSLLLTALCGECNPSLHFVRGLMSDLTRLATHNLRLRLGFRNLIQLIILVHSRLHYCSI